MLILSPVHRRRTSAAAVLAILLLLVACKKNEQTPTTTPPATTITSLSSQILNAGDPLLLRGIALGTDASIVAIQLDTIVLKVDRCQDSLVAVTLPPASQLHYYGSRTLTLSVTINGKTRYTNTYNLTVKCPEPKGWFDLYRGNGVLNYVGFESACISLAFADDTIGYMHYKDNLLKTTDGGLSWQHPDFHYGNALCMSVFDTATVWSGDLGFVNITRDGARSWTNHRLPAGLNDLIIGQYMTGATTGLIAGAAGRIYRVAGASFDTTSEFTQDYQSKWAGSSLVWGSLSAVDADNLLLGGVGTDKTVFPAVYRPLVAVKTNGVYDEYLLPSGVTAATGLTQVQMIYNALGFAVTSDNDLLKYTGNRTWTVLPQKATAALFTDELTGYAAYNEKIYRSTDGGQTWSPVWSLRSGDAVINFTTRNGRLWAIGNNQTPGGWFIEKYNP